MNSSVMFRQLLPALVCAVSAQQVPDRARVINQKSLNALGTVRPPAEMNFNNIFLPPGMTEEEAHERPFHIHDDAFADIIGPSPTLTLIAKSDRDPLFHEAVVWYPPTDEMFFVQNAGARAAGTGLKKSNIIQKISLKQAQEVADARNKSRRVDVITVAADPPVINSNGGTNFRGQIAFAAEGQGDRVAPALYLMNPRAPYNTSVLINNFHGRQFNSLNDVAVHPRNGHLYFTDSLYGYLQNFRPPPGLPTQVYRLDPDTGAISVVADEFDKPNGITFSPDGGYAYVTDTGAQSVFYGFNLSAPATIYRYSVEGDGTFSGRKVFAFVSPGIPDGVHCDTKGNVYSGVGDGIHVWNPSGKLLGKIFLGQFIANFRWASKGRMIIMAQTEMYYATLAAEGADPEHEY